MAAKIRTPWKALDPYRGKEFTTEWPTFPQLIKINVERFGNNPCFTDFEGENGAKQTITYNQAYEYIQNVAKWLIENGIQKGDHVAVTGKNSPEWAIAYLATMFASATVIPIDYALKENETQNLINASEPKIIFVDEEKYDSIKNNNPNAKIVSLSSKKDENHLYNLKASADVAFNEPVTPDDNAVILFTSGTTGVPKGVMLTHQNLISDAYIAQTQLLILPTDTFYALLPIHHAYTMQAAFICPLTVGAEIVFGKSMSVSRLMKELKEGHITVMLGVPLLYNKLISGIRKGIKEKGAVVSGVMSFLMGLSYITKKLTGINPGSVFFKPVLKQANISTLRVAICGGGPLASSVFKTYNAMGINFIQGYGLTETSPIIALNPLEKFKIESVGRSFEPYAQIKILNPDADGIGEIAAKGPMVMKGYYKMPEETAKMFTEDGWFKTGDLGKIDSEYYVTLCGRAKNMIVTSGGKNVYPEEIEDAFQLCDDIQQIVVQGYTTKEDETSEEIEALIYPSDSAYEALGQKREEDFNSAQINQRIQNEVSKVNKTLQPYARITRITILENPLEMTTTKKIKRNYKK